MICKREWDLRDMQSGMGFAVICKLERDLCASGDGICVICKREWDLRDMQAGMGFA